MTYNAMAIRYEQTSFDIEGENTMSTKKVEDRLVKAGISTQDEIHSWVMEKLLLGLIWLVCLVWVVLLIVYYWQVLR